MSKLASLALRKRIIRDDYDPGDYDPVEARKPGDLCQVPGHASYLDADGTCAECKAVAEHARRKREQAKAKGKRLIYDPNNPLAFFDRAVEDTKQRRIEPRWNGGRPPLVQPAEALRTWLPGQSPAFFPNTWQGIADGQEKKSLIRGGEPVMEFKFSNLSLNAMRNMLCLVFDVNTKHDTEFREFKFTAASLSRALKLNRRLSREEVKALLSELFGKYFIFLTGEIGLEHVHLMGVCKRDPDGTIHQQLHDTLVPHMLNIRRDFHQLLPVVFDLQSVRSILMYRFARRYIGYRIPSMRRPRVALAVLRKVLEVDEDMDWYELRRKILDPAIAEINKVTEINLDYKVVEKSKHGKAEKITLEVDEKVVVMEPDKEPVKLLENKEPVIRPRKLWVIPPRKVTT